jgi:hypothetical protein
MAALTAAELAAGRTGAPLGPRPPRRPSRRARPRPPPADPCRDCGRDFPHARKGARRWVCPPCDRARQRQGGRPRAHKRALRALRDRHLAEFARRRAAALAALPEREPPGLRSATAVTPWPKARGTMADDRALGELRDHHRADYERLLAGELDRAAGEPLPVEVPQRRRRLAQPAKHRALRALAGAHPQLWQELLAAERARVNGDPELSPLPHRQAARRIYRRIAGARDLGLHVPAADLWRARELAWASSSYARQLAAVATNRALGRLQAALPDEYAARFAAELAEGARRARRRPGAAGGLY